MSKIESKLKELGFHLPDLPEPIANYIPAKRTGNLIHTAGQIRSYNGEISRVDLVRTLH